MPHCQTIIQHLRQKGYRITPQREMIIESIAHSNSHMSAEEVFSELQKRTKATNIATVYRTLEMLWEEGLACRNDLGEGHIVYATREHGPHIHLICRYCGTVIDADPRVLRPLKERLNSEYRFEADLQHLSIFGVCKGCQHKNLEQ
jgi:Fur family ferric uptake transcriptional regulator